VTTSWPVTYTSERKGKKQRTDAVEITSCDAVFCDLLNAARGKKPVWRPAGSKRPSLRSAPQNGKQIGKSRGSLLAFMGAKINV